MPAKIAFRVIHASGQDDNYKASQLNTHSPTTKGWQSSRFCLYPQDIVLQLESRCKIRKIQLLSHQYLIASKVELFVGDVADGTPLPAQNARYKRLGYVEMSDNERTEYKARELKSVHVDAVGQYIKLLIHKNHVNKLNLYNQVSIIAINVLGEELFPKASDLSNDDINNPKYSDNDVTSDLAFDLYQDPQVAQIIRKLEQKKQQAVIEERYEYAKRLKTAIQDLHEAGKKLGKYEVEKRRAVEEEDYDLAKLKKVQLDEYRLQVYEELRVQDLLEPENVPSTSDPVFDTARRQTPPIRLAELQHEGDFTHRSTNSPTGALRPYEDRVLPAIAKNDRANRLSPRGDELSSTNENVPVQDVNPDEYAERPPAGPEPLSAKDQKEAAAVVDVFGMPLACKAFSKHWAFRDDAITEVYNTMSQLPAKEADSARSMMHASIPVINRGVRDNVHSVYGNALRLKRMILTDYIKRFKIPRSEVTSFIEQTFPHVLMRTGDTAQRQRDAAKSYIIDASGFPGVKPLNIITRECVEPFKPSTPARLAQSRVEIVDMLYDQHGLDNSGLTLDNMMKFLTEGLAHKSSSEVRQASEEVIVKLYRNIGSPVKDYLPPDSEKTRKNVLYKQLFVAFDKIDGKTYLDKKNPDTSRRDYDSKAKDHAQDTSRSVKPKGAKNDSKQDSPRQPQQHSKTDNRHESPKPAEKLCIFCDERNEGFTEEGLDVHYWKACPMLTRCPQCKIVVEIAELTRHCLDECEKKATVSKCPRCSEAILKTDFKSHTASKTCPPADKTKGRCPLCHQNIDDPSEESWKAHLMGKNGCSANPRRSGKAGKSTAAKGNAPVSRVSKQGRQPSGSPSPDRRNNSRSPSRSVNEYTPRGGR